MKTIKNLFTALLLVLFLSAIIIACKKATDDPQPTPTPVTSITSIDPSTAPVGSTIAITGTNFNTNPASNTITIGGVTATIVSATATRLVVVVPTGAANGPVSVTAGGQTAQSAASFTVAIPSVKPVKEVRGTTFANQNWKKDTVYLIRGMVYIPADYTLTIDPGTVIKGAGPELDPTGQNISGTLVIERRGKIIAKGTAAQPIVFTSAKAVGQRAAGDWGGLVLIGKAAINRPASTSFAGGVRGVVETYSEFDDNSGTLQYVRIEFGGTSQPNAPTNKLNGLTLYGVGYNTTIDHVQVSYSSNDAFGWFGGTVNAKNLVAYRGFDDDWSSDWGYVGKVQFGVALRDPAVGNPAGSNGIESQNFDPGENADGPLAKQNGLPQTAPIFANISNFAFSSTPTVGLYQAGIFLSRNTAISLYNSLFYGYPEGLHLDGTATGTLANITSGALDLKGIVLANTLTPVVGTGVITNDLATAYFAGAGRTNLIVQTSDLASLLFNGANFTLTAPNFLPQAGSPLLTGAATGGKVADSFFTSVSYRGAFGTDNWISSWTNFNPQSTDYDR
ncbi:IPT/TIG domain-containing protein [Spirosoma flavum]|uniref:IPT/TIG domain-containing protein n=1 Tax=Spirosoma flavum TaxID=2048557 RepID=A0ABW6ANY7_9BACT